MKDDVLASQFKSILPEFVLPFISTAPVPLGAITKSLFETVTISFRWYLNYHRVGGVVSSNTSKLAAADAAAADEAATVADEAAFVAEYLPLRL